MQHKGEYIWALVGRFLPLFIYLITTMVLARFLTPDDFGKVGALSIFFVVANALMDAGLGGSLVKEPYLSKVDCSTILVFNITISHFLYLILFFSSGIIEDYFDVEGLSLIVRILCLVFVINSWGLVPRSLLIRDLQFKTLSIVNIVGVSIAAISSVIFAFFNFGVYALVAYQILNSLFCVLLSILLSHYKLSFRFSWDSLRRLFSFGMFTTLATTIDTIYENLITFLFGKYLNMQEAGYLNQAKRLEEVPSQGATSTISSVSFPVLTKIRDDHEAFDKECMNIFKTVLLILIPLLFCISLFSKEIIWIVFGEQWLPAAPYLSLLIWAAIFHIAETLNRTFIKSSCRVELLFKYTIVKRLLGIGVILLLLMVDPKLILHGYIISTIIGFIVNAVILSSVSAIGFWKQISSFLSYMLPGVVFLGLMFFIQFIFLDFGAQLLFCLTILSVYYLGILRLYNIEIFSFLSNYIKSNK